MVRQVSDSCQNVFAAGGAIRSLLVCPRVMRVMSVSHFLEVKTSATYPFHTADQEPSQHPEL